MHACKFSPRLIEISVMIRDSEHISTNCKYINLYGILAVEQKVLTHQCLKFYIRHVKFKFRFTTYLLPFNCIKV